MWEGEHLDRKAELIQYIQVDKDTVRGGPMVLPTRLILRREPQNNETEVYFDDDAICYICDHAVR